MSKEKAKDRHAFDGNGTSLSDQELLEEWINDIYDLFNSSSVYPIRFGNYCNKCDLNVLS